MKSDNEQGAIGPIFWIKVNLFVSMSRYDTLPMQKQHWGINMRRLIILMAIGALVGCETLFEPTVDSFLDRKGNGYVLEKKNEHCLDGPYKIIDRTTGYTMFIEKGNVRYTLSLRGCKPIGLESAVANTVMGSYYEDLGAYLLKDSVVNVSSNEIKAVVYSPANRVYVGGTKGFDNLTYVMPQVLHIANGELCVDHSDTNYPLYTVFRDAEKVAKKNHMGYWATHAEPPAEAKANDVPNGITR